MDTYDLWLEVLPSAVFSHFIVCYLEFIQPIELLQWLREIPRWVNRVPLARGNR